MTAERDRIAALETELAQVREQLFRMGRLVEMGKLIAVVAHELSQPLLGIKAFAQILQRRCEDDDYVGPKVRIIAQQAKVMEGIIDSLREFTRALPDEPEGVALEQVIAAALELFSERSRKAKVSIRADLPPDLPPVRGNRGHLQQVVVNLISNSLDELEARGGGTIQLRLRRHDGDLVLGVADDGPGVPAEVKPRLFEPFYTTKGQDHGTGLGLSICRDILELHGGAIRLLEAAEAEAAYGADCGAAFEVRLPRFAPGESESPGA